MKKLILTIGLCIITLEVMAQNHYVGSFLAQQSLQVSNVAAVSNLVIYPGMSNIFGGRWTNNAGTAVNVTTAGNTTKLLQDVTLWSDREGNMPFRQFWAVQGTVTNYHLTTPFTVSGKLIGGAGANAAVTFTLTPYWKDHDAGETPFTASTHDFTFAVTSASGNVTFATNVVNAYLWTGAKGVRVRSIVNADTDFTGGIYLTDLDLSGFKP